MKQFYQMKPKQWPKQGIFKNPRKPFKIKGFTPHRPLTTPPHRDFVEVVRSRCGVCCGWGWWWWVVCVVCGVWCVVGGGGLVVGGRW